MATEKRLIYDEDAKQRIIALAVGHHTDTLPLDMIINVLLHQAPTVDAVEVVRCKNCEFWNDGWFPECTMGKCRRGKPVLTEPHHYCAYGVRRLDVPVIIKDESFVVKEETEK